MSDSVQPVFSRRSFLFFIVLAPACLAAVAGIVITLQVKQYRLLVAESPVVEEFSATDGSALVQRLLERFADFSAGRGSDTLRLTTADLSALVAASSATAEGIRFRFTATDSHLVVESTRRVEELEGRLAWLFKRIAPIPDGWLNARMVGVPELKGRELGFAVTRGFLNDSKVPRAALTKRGGLSPKDFLHPRYEPEYTAFVGALASAAWNGTEIVFVRKQEAAARMNGE